MNAFYLLMLQIGKNLYELEEVDGWNILFVFSVVGKQLLAIQLICLQSEWVFASYPNTVFRGKKKLMKMLSEKSVYKVFVSSRF